MLKSGFQYISCYCLSCPKIVGDNVDLSFQYISCYCLSSVIQVDRFHASSFQYISCYCLSYLRHVYSHLSLNFNTSHVTVYRYHSTSFFFATFISIHLMLLFIPSGILSSWSTTTFQYISCYCLSRCNAWLRNKEVISIHLMLLFISFASSSGICPRRFQYISCYCLSNPENSPSLLRLFQYISCYCLSAFGKSV